MVHITLLAYPNCSVSSLMCPIDALGVANLTHKARMAADNAEEHPLFDWDIVTADGKPVEGFGQMPVHPHKAMADIEKTDVVLIPGCIPPMTFIGNLDQAIKGKNKTSMLSLKCRS